MLASAAEIWHNVPSVLLREHYRCHPKIAAFFNQKFYNGELIVMTADQGEQNVLTMYRTAPGNHARGHLNQRQIDVIREEVLPALQKAESSGKPAAAMELPDGKIVTGKTSNLLGASAALLLNALKTLAGIDDDLHLIAPEVIDPIQHLKVDHFGNRNPRLHTDEVLIALSICAATDPRAEMAMEQLSKLRGCEVHSSVILSPVDEKTFKRLGVNLTCQPRYKG